MAAVEDAGSAREGRPNIIAEALRDAVITAFIAFVLFGSLIGFKTDSLQEVLILRYRWDWAIGFTLAVAVARFLLDVYVWRRAQPIDVLAAATGASAWMPAVKAMLPILYVAGAIFFLAPETRLVVAGALISLAPFAAWEGPIATGSNLATLAIMAGFILLTAMLAARALRLLYNGFRPAAAAERPRFDARAMTDNLLGEFAPALLIIALVLPMLVAGPQQRYAMDTAIQVVTYIMLGWGLNVVVGLAGLLDLGYVAFYAVGAYSYALLATQFGLSFWICLPLAGILAAFCGILLGFPVLRLRGDYLAIVTLAFGEIIRIVLINWGSLTGGPNGINLIPQLSFFGLPFNRSDGGFAAFFGIEFNSAHRIIFFYYVILALALLTNYVTTRLRRLPIGRAWEALREDEIACRSLGINTVTTKLSAFAIGAMFAGFAGSFFATKQGFISPESFTFHESALVLAIVVLGGLGSQMGVVIAAVALIGSSEFFRELEEYRLIIFGASMVLLMTWRPRGLVATRTPSAVLHERKAISADLVREGRG